MKKSLLLSSLLVVSLFANEEEYIFKAKGEFATQLKALIEQHAKDGQVQIQKVEPNSGRYANGIINAFLSDDISSGDTAYGKTLYEARCTSCHGANAEHSTYANARVLKTLSKETLITALTGYAEDDSFGGSTATLMRTQAQGLTTDQRVSIASYIYSIDHKSTPTQSTNTQNKSNDIIIDLDKKSYIK